MNIPPLRGSTTLTVGAASLFPSVNDLLYLHVRPVHRVFRSQLAAICFGKIDAEGVLDFIPLRRAWTWPRTFKRSELRRVRRKFGDEFRISEQRPPCRRVPTLCGQLHLFAAGRP